MSRAQLATFEVGGHLLGITVLEVQEVLRRQPLTPVPLAPREIAGLINLRGQIIPAVEMRTLLRLDERPDPENALSVVLRTQIGPVSLQMDEIGDVLEVEMAALDPPPRNLDSQVRRFLSGVCQVAGQTSRKLLLVLDTARAIDPGAACDGPDMENNGLEETGTKCQLRKNED